MLFVFGDAQRHTRRLNIVRPRRAFNRHASRSSGVTSRHFGARSPAVVTIAVLLTASIAGTAWAAPPPAAAAPAGSSAAASSAKLPTDCATVLPVGDVKAGMTGRGWTVDSGSTPKPFTVKVLAVLPDGIAPGVDMIVIKAGDVAGSHMIKNAGGIWQGMSGSPVYVHGKLIGAVSYRLTYNGGSPLGGLTPASTMMELLGYPTHATVTKAGPRFRAHVAVPVSMRAALARQAGITEAQAASLSMLTLPLAVSGLSAIGRRTLQTNLDRQGRPMDVTTGTRATAPGAASTFATPRPGGNFAALLSYGDVTAGAVGTTTYVCKGVAIAFGHPMDFSGPATYGASDAPVFAIVKDALIGPMKLTSIGAPFGTVDQDRLTGIRGQVGTAPPLIPVTSKVTDPDNGRARSGETDVTSADYVADLAASHVYANFITVFSQETAGGAFVSWTATGRRSDGTPWTYTRTNRFVSGWNIAYDSLQELYSQLWDIYANPFDHVTFDAVSVTASITARTDSDSLKGVDISVNGGPFKERTTLHVKPGDKLRIRPIVQTSTGTITAPTIKMTVPDTGGNPATLTLNGGNGQYSNCDYDPTSCATTFDGYLQALHGFQRNDAISAQILVNDPNTGATTVTASKSVLEDAVVNGSVGVTLSIP